jgi:hypothetical protein
MYSTPTYQNYPGNKNEETKKICIRVSEAAIMLSLIVIMTRMYGNDRCINLMTDKS